MDLAEYFALMESRPHLFANPPGFGFKVLTDEAAIRAAERAKADALEAAGQPRAWATVGIVFRDQYRLILRNAVEFADGSTGTYARIVRPDDATPGVAVLTVCRGEVVLLEHDREATRATHLEIPRGHGTPGLTPLEGAKLELREELQAEGIRWEPLGQFHTNTGATSDVDELFFVEIAGRGDGDPNEGIRHVRSVPIDEFEAMIADGRVTDSYSIAAYARAKLKGLLG